VLVVDDDRLIREMVRDALVCEDFGVVCAGSGPTALALLEDDGPFDLVITDLSMREMDGLALCAQIKRRSPKTDVMILTGYASLESALEAMRLGAADYLRKPVSAGEIVHGVKRTLLRRSLLAENEALRGSVQTFEASRVLASCLETGDILPLSLDIALRLVGRQRGVGRLEEGIDPGGSEACLSGFDDELGARLRHAIERDKLLDPASLDGTKAAAPAPLAHLGIPEGVLGLPLRVEGRVAGGLWLLDDGRPFEEHEVRRAELVAAHAELALSNADRFFRAREKAFVDDVTELYNARYLLSALDREVSRAARTNLELSVLFLDLDRFKSVNDTHGHLVGSRVLRELGTLLQRSVRAVDTLGRYGGDEFTILLVETGHGEALQVADRIRASVEQARFSAERALRLALTVSIGVASFPRHGLTREALLDRADKAMYLGKALGRNRVCSGDELSGEQNARGG
jgi:diguanylate cyclase (GGDEF)-like protein